jgi:hypothetical protein
MIKDSVLFMLYHFNFLLPIEMIKDSVLFMLYHFNFLLPIEMHILVFVYICIAFGDPFIKRAGLVSH